MLIDPLLWQKERERLAAILMPIINTLAQLGAMAAAQKLQNQGVTIDPTPGNWAAAAWARAYTDELLNRLGSTTEKTVGEILGTWIETPGATRQDLVYQLRPVLKDNSYRANLIGNTEATRAYAQGNKLVYEAAGIPTILFPPPGHPGCRCWDSPKRVKGQMVVVWQTNRDEIVCRQPIVTPWGVVEGCRELHNVCISEGEYLGQKV